jgi:DNA-binding LytR/AlgR family response regulator
MIRAVVIENRPLEGQQLATLLEDTWQVEVIGTTTDSATGLRLSTESNPDAIFVDIDLSNDRSLAAALAKLEPPPLLVFAARNAERAAEAFRSEAVYCLIKPWDTAQVAEAVERLMTCLQPVRRGWPNSAPRGRAFLAADKIVFADTAYDLLPVTGVDRDQIRLLAPHEVVAVLRRERRTWIHTVLEEFSTYYPLAELMRWLGAEPYIQIHRHAVVNIRAIEQIERSGDRVYTLKLHDRLGTEVVTSRAGAHRLAAALRAGITPACS